MNFFPLTPYRQRSFCSAEQICMKGSLGPIKTRSDKTTQLSWTGITMLAIHITLCWFRQPNWEVGGVSKETSICSPRFCRPKLTMLRLRDFSLRWPDTRLAIFSSCFTTCKNSQKVEDCQKRKSKQVYENIRLSIFCRRFKTNSVATRIPPKLPRLLVL